MATNKEHNKVIRKLPGSNGDDAEIQSAVRGWPRGSLHEGASSWNDATAGAAAARTIGIQLRKPSY